MTIQPSTLKSERALRQSVAALKRSSEMKIIGLFLIAVGIACFAFVASGLFAWTTPAPESSTPSSLADTLVVKMLFFFAIGAVCTIGGFVALIRGIMKSRRAKAANME